MQELKRPIVLRRYGGDLQPLIEDLAGLRRAVALPPAAWAVMACPLADLRLAASAQRAFDNGGDGRLTIADLRRSLRFYDERVAGDGPADRASTNLAPEDLRRDEDRDLIERLAVALGCAGPLGVAELQRGDLLGIHGDADGSVPLTALDASEATLAAEVLAVTGRDDDQCAVEDLQRFAAARQERLDWFDALARNRPWGVASEELAAGIIALDAAVQQWFVLCRLAQRDAELAADCDTVAIPSGSCAAAIDAALQAAPLAAPVTDETPRLLREAVRPSHRPAVDAIAAVWPTGGFDEAGWQMTLTRAREFTDLVAAGESQAARVLAEDRLRYLQAATLEPLRKRCEDDAAAAADRRRLQELRDLVAVQSNLLAVGRNCCSLHDLFDPARTALFEQGTVVLAGWSFHFVVAVADRASHARRVASSGICVVYVGLLDGSARCLALAVTRGDPARFWVGRRGLFIDPAGTMQEVDVLEVVANPVSWGQAIGAPFLRLGAYIGGRLERWSGKLDQGFDGEVARIAAEQAAVPEQPVERAPRLVGGTMAIAAAGSAFAFITAQLAELSAPTILLALVVVVAGLLVPTALLAFWRLYRRDLAAVLAAGGWAVNDRTRLTAGLARLFTRAPQWPDDAVTEWQDQARRYLAEVDPAADAHLRLARSTGWIVALAVAALLLAFCLPSRGVGAVIGLMLVLAAGSAQIISSLIVLMQARGERRLRLAVLLASIPVLVLLVAWFDRV